MRAARYHEYGDPQVLRVEDVPEPHAPAGAIRIRVLAASVNPVDWKLRAGYAREVMPLDLPVTTGRDAAGVVDEVGEGVTGVAVGDLVFGLGGLADTTAEHVVLTAWAHVPDAWTPEQAASAGLASATALLGLAALGDLAGKTLLVEGAAGAVGSAAVVFAVEAGARVIGTASERNHGYLADLGALPTTYGDGLAERVAALAPDGVDVVLDTAGSGSLDDLVAIAGSTDRGGPGGAAAGGRRPGVRHVYAENRSDLMARAAALGTTGTYVPRVAEVVPLEDVARAHELAQSGAPAGKVVVTLAATA
jgi:NADPH:quinone reductase-like Zn-dependent oxidoreductase